MLGSMLADVWVGSNHKVQRGGDRPQFSQRGALLDAWASWAWAMVPLAPELVYIGKP